MRKTFSETRDTVFFDLRTPEEKVMMVLKMILVRVSLSGISFVLGVKEETIRSREELGLSASEIVRHTGVSTSSITRTIEKVTKGMR